MSVSAEIREVLKNASGPLSADELLQKCPSAESPVDLGGALSQFCKRGEVHRQEVIGQRAGTYIYNHSFVPGRHSPAAREQQVPAGARLVKGRDTQDDETPKKRGRKPGKAAKAATVSDDSDKPAPTKKEKKKRERVERMKKVARKFKPKRAVKKVARLSAPPPTRADTCRGSGPHRRVRHSRRRRAGDRRRGQQCPAAGRGSEAPAGLPQNHFSPLELNP